MSRDAANPAFHAATWRLVFAIAVCLVGHTQAGVAGGMSIRRWQTEQGLPQNSVTCLLQSREGYIWFGTYAGLVRFDGVRLSVLDSERFPGLADNRITALFEDRQGALWIGHEAGNVTCLSNGVMRGVTLPAAVRLGEILGIAADAQGAVWVLNREGWVAQPEQGTIIQPHVVPGTLPNSYGLALTTEGTLWCLRRGKLDAISVEGPRNWQAPNASSSLPVQAISAAPIGGIWISTGGRVRRMKSDKWLDNPLDQPWSGSAIGCLTGLKSGGVVVGTRAHGLYVCDASGRVEHFSQTNGLGENWVRSVCEDRESTIWAGLGNAGLNALHATSFEAVNPPDRWEGCSVMSVAAAKDGSLWTGTEGAGIYRWLNGNWSRYTEAEGLMIRYVWSVAETKNGQLLVGTWGGGLFAWLQDRFRSAPGLENMTRPVTALLAGTNDEMWIGTADGVGRYKAGQVTWLRELEGVRLLNVRCLALGQEQTLWVGMNGGGLARYQAGRCRLFKKADGLGSDFISCLYFDVDGDLWIGTAGGGLTRYRKERFARVGSRQGLPSLNISSVQEDTSGTVWLGSSAGVLQIRKKALNACADGGVSNLVVKTYGLGDGLETTECSGGFQPASCTTADGFIYFPTRRGLVRVNPAALVTNARPPPSASKASAARMKMSLSPRLRRPTP